MIRNSINSSALYSALNKYLQEANNKKQNKQVHANALELNLFNFQADYIITINKILADIHKDNQDPRMYETPKEHIFCVLDRVMKQVCKFV